MESYIAPILQLNPVAQILFFGALVYVGMSALDGSFRWMSRQWPLFSVFMLINVAVVFAAYGLRDLVPAPPPSDEDKWVTYAMIGLSVACVVFLVMLFFVTRDRRRPAALAADAGTGKQ